MDARPGVVCMMGHLLTDFLFQCFYLISFQIFKPPGYKMIKSYYFNTISREKSYVLMSVSCSVTVQSIFTAAQFVALLAIVATASHMLHFNMVLHVSCVLAHMFAISALPNTR